MLRQFVLVFLVFVSVSFAKQDCEFVHLTSYAEAEAFATCVEETVKEKVNLEHKRVSLHLFHLASAGKINKYHRWALLLLEKKGFEVKGDVVNEEELDQLFDRANVYSQFVNGKFALSSQGWSESIPFEVAQLETRKGFWNRLQLASRVAFHKILRAHPEGPTFFSHFFKRNPETGKLEQRYEVQPGQRKFALKNASIAMAWLGGIRFILGYLVNGPLSNLWNRVTDPVQFANFVWENTNAEFLALGAAIFAWVGTTLYLSPSLYAFRKQGRKLVVDPKAPDGHQISATTDPVGFLAACMIQELVWNTLVLGIQGSLGNQFKFDLESAMDRAKNGALGAGSYAAMENLRGKILEEASKAREEGKIELANELQKRANKLGTTFWSLLFPITYNTAMFIPGAFSSIPLMALGAFGLFRNSKSEVELERDLFKKRVLGFPSFPTPNPVSVSSLGCSDLLIIRSHVKNRDG